MSISKYDLYCPKLGLRQVIDVNGGRAVRGIYVRNTSVGSVLIEVLFKFLGVIIDIYFVLLEVKVPTPMCLKDV